MRLLDTTTLEIISFLSDTTPPYAILSHTWGLEQDEPTLQQLQELALAGRRDASAWSRHPTALKKGYIKIRSACSLALSQGYRYIWVDTCCIDKTSSAELSEAINSMYRWYEGAGVCYVFLDDVDVGPGIMNPDISRCKWFTRGWTLQELVAPANVMFYDYKWSYIGSKRDRPDFREQLSRTTGVDGRVLSGEMGVEELSVACRMAWAAGRRTTRPEDVAYCLMGIFQVNMPLLYGEGESKAFIRLQEEILRSVEDHSLFAWKYPKGDPLSSQLSGLLASSPRYFQETSHVVPSVPDIYRPIAPSSLTNAGLHVQLRLRPVHPNSVGGTSTVGICSPADLDNEAHTDYIAILNCAPFMGADKREYYHCLWLVALGSGQFARIQSDELIKVDSSVDDPSIEKRPSKGFTYVYVKQKPAWVLPEINLEELEGLDEDVSYSLIEVYPSSRWNRASRTLRSGHSRLNKVLGGFRYRISRSSGPDQKFSYLDVFIIGDQIEGQMGNWFAAPICRDVVTGHTLQQTCLGISQEEDCAKLMMPSATQSQQLNISRYGMSASLVKFRKMDKICFRLKLHKSDAVFAVELDGKEVFGSARIYTPANFLRNRAEMDHLVALTRRMACEVVDDTIDLTFRQSVNMVRELPSKIRMTPRNGRSNAQADLQITLADVRTYAFQTKLAGENWTELGIFEQYFTNKLAAACITGDVAAVRELVQTKLVSVSLEVTTTGGSFNHHHLSSRFLAFKPIHWAAIFGHTEIVRLLTDNGADQYSKTVAGFTTVHLAAAMGHGDLVDYLLEDWKPSQIADLDQTRQGRLEEPPAHLAAAYDLSDNGPSILRNERMKPPMEANNPSYPRFGRPDETATEENGYTTTTKPEQPPTTNTNTVYTARNGLGEAAMHRAAAMNNTTSIYTLAKIAATCHDTLGIKDGYGRTPLWHAAATGASEAVILLLDLGAGVDAADVYGRTPLHIACREGRPGAAGLLLKAGADVNKLTTAPCLSACHFAVLGADMDCLRLVVEFGGKADLCRTEGLEVGAIHIAAANGWLEGVRFLVEMGCDPNTPCSHLVRTRGHSQTGTGVNVARFQFNNARELAVRGGHGDVVEYLDGL